jgi:hypothetical protein
VKKEEKPEGKKEDHKISSIGMSPLKRQVPSHIKGFGNILIGYAERVMQKGVEVFHKMAAIGTWRRRHSLSI